MAKFEVRLKVTGLELEIKGEREDIPLLTRNLGGQITGMLTPTTLIAQGQEPPMLDSADNQFNGDGKQEGATESKPRRRPRQRRQKDNDGNEAATAVDWKHDPSKWGTPRQDWSVADKAIWLLHVVANEIPATALSGSSIVSTFNKHFKQAGTIYPALVARELGKLKSASPAIAGEDTTVVPSTWFLTHEGTKRAEQLVSEAKGTGTPE